MSVNVFAKNTPICIPNKEPKLYTLGLTLIGSFVVKMIYIPLLLKFLCCIFTKNGSLGSTLIGSRALSVVESAEEGANLLKKVKSGVNLSDFCRYYQQPTNNTPEFALRIARRNSSSCSAANILLTR